MDRLVVEIGLQFDKSLLQKYPEINASTSAENGNMCGICYCEFEDDDEEMKVDQLVCGHQYNAMCWKYYLKEKVSSEGPGCVFTKCPQLRCNVVVPHSYFLKYLHNGPDPDDGINYWDKYMDWHIAQFTDSSPNYKWCPKAGCGRIIEKFEYTLQKSLTCVCGETYCYKCGEESHEPAGCRYLK